LENNFLGKKKKSKKNLPLDRPPGVGSRGQRFTGEVAFPRVTRADGALSAPPLQRAALAGNDMVAPSNLQ
jgi:hypothetical protein